MKIAKPTEGECIRFKYECWADPLWVAIYGTRADELLMRKLNSAVDDPLVKAYIESQQKEINNEDSDS